MNGGIAAAIKRVNKNFAAGFPYSAELDIRRCFQSFQADNLARLLRLPESVVEHGIRINNLIPVPSRTCREDILHHLLHDPETPAGLFQAILGSEWEQARLGLPEGSKLSPMVAELLLSPIARRLVESRLGRLVTFADNFFLAATSSDHLHALVRILQEELARHPAGPVSVRYDFVARNPKDAFEFLGYCLTPDGNRLGVTWASKHEEHARRMRREAYRKLQSPMPHYRS